MRTVSFFAQTGLTLAFAVLAGCGGTTQPPASNDMATGTGKVGFAEIFKDMQTNCAMTVTCHGMNPMDATNLLKLDPSGATMANYTTTLTYVTKGDGANSQLVTIGAGGTSPKTKAAHKGGAVLSGATKDRWIAWINNQAPFPTQ